MQTEGCEPERTHLLEMEPRLHVLIQRADGKTKALEEELGVGPMLPMTDRIS